MRHAETVHLRRREELRDRLEADREAITMVEMERRIEAAARKGTMAVLGMEDADVVPLRPIQ